VPRRAMAIFFLAAVGAGDDFVHAAGDVDQDRRR
jgi:hypothetical protein